MRRLSRRAFMRASLGALVASQQASLVGHAKYRAGVSAQATTPLLQAQGSSDTSVELIWMAVPNAAQYSVYRNEARVKQQAGTLFVDTSLTPETAYSYQVAAVVAGVEHPRSPAVAVSTQAPRNTAPPSQPGAITVSQVTASGAQLSWPDSSDDHEVTGYRMLRGAVGAPISALTQIGTTDAIASYSATGLRAATAYQFAVIAVDADNNLSEPRTVTFTTGPSSDTTVPITPSSSSIVARVFSSSRVDVLWASSPSTDIASYQIFRDNVLVGEVGPPLRRYFSDNGLQPNTTYTYAVRAVDTAGNVSAPTTGRKAKTFVEGTVRIVRGPYLQRTSDSATLIVWWTNIPADSRVSYGAGALVAQVQDSAPAYRHVMLVGGLSAGTTYSYQVASGDAVSATAQFTTAPAPGTPFAFAAVGDYGGGSAQQSALAEHIAASGTQFVQSLGDNVYPDAQDPDFATTYHDFDARFYKQYSAVIATRPLWAANGNKEYYGDGAAWRNFLMPNNSRWYSYNWGDVHMLVLDTEQPFEPGTPQYRFAQADLQAAQGFVWRVAVVHRPPYSSGTAGASSRSVREILAPLFEQLNVQLVLSGNSHNYERTKPLRSATPQPNGVVYTVSGGGGNGLNQFIASQPDWSAFRQAVYEYLRIEVSPQQLLVTAIGTDGAALDSFRILAPSPDGSAQVYGVVTDAYTNAPLPNALVALGATTTTSDSSGNYTFTGVLPGSYTLSASLADYATKNVAVVVAQGQRIEQSFALEIVADPARSGSLGGTVVDADTDAPVAGATLECNGVKVLSDGAGAYRFDGLPVGPHVLVVNAQRYRPQSRKVSVVSGANTAQRFALEVVPGSGDPTKGSLVGTVVNALTGAEIGGAIVRCAGQSVTSDADGRFVIADLAPGTYPLSVDATGYQSAASQVAVVAGDVTTLYLPLVPSNTPQQRYRTFLPIVVR